MNLKTLSEQLRLSMLFRIRLQEVGLDPWARELEPVIQAAINDGIVVMIDRTNKKDVSVYVLKKR